MEIRGKMFDRILVPIWKAPGIRTCFLYRLFRNFFLDFSRKYFNDFFIDLYIFMNLSEDPSNNFSEDSFCKSLSNLSRNYSSNILKDAKKSLSVSSRKSFNILLWSPYQCSQELLGIRKFPPEISQRFL